MEKDYFYFLQAQAEEKYCVTCNEKLDQKFHCVNTICVEYEEEK